MGFYSDGEQYRHSFSSLPRLWKIIIVVGSILFLGVFTAWAGVWMKDYFFGTSELAGFLNGIIVGKVSSDDPAILGQLIKLIAIMFAILIVLIIDTVVNVAVLFYAMRRKNYPPSRDRELWLAGLWSAFAFVQAPTGILSAIFYWIFVESPARKLERPKNNTLTVDEGK